MGVAPIPVEKRELRPIEIGGRGIEGWTGHWGERGTSALLLLHVLQTNYMFTFFLTWGQGGPPSFIYRIAQDVQEGAIPNRPLGKEQGRKEVR